MRKKGRHHGAYDKGSSGKSHLSGGRRYVIGRHVIEELLEHSPERIERIYVAEVSSSSFKSEGARRRELVNRLAAAGRDVQLMSFDELSMLVQTPSHQGFAAIVRERDFPSLAEFLDESADKERSLVLLLDEISDPQNLGALLRAAECFGVDAVIWSKNRGSDITPAVSKASVGASEIVTILKVSNLAEAARKLKSAGYWIASAVLDERAVSIHSFDPPAKTALIVGSEGEGIGRVVVELSDYLIYIPMAGKLQSLNVSQAASVLLYELRKKIG